MLLHKLILSSNSTICLSSSESLHSFFFFSFLLKQLSSLNFVFDRWMLSVKRGTVCLMLVRFSTLPLSLSRCDWICFNYFEAYKKSGLNLIFWLQNLLALVKNRFIKYKQNRTENAIQKTIDFVQMKTKQNSKIFSIAI